MNYHANGMPRPADPGLRSMINFENATLFAGGLGLKGLAMGLRGAAKTSTKLLGQPINQTAKGLAHVLDRHTINGIAKYAGKSKFANPAEVSKLIQQATHHPMTLQANGNYARIINVGRNIGTNMVTGKPTSIYTVITRPNGNLVTAFPGRPF